MKLWIGYEDSVLRTLYWICADAAFYAPGIVAYSFAYQAVVVTLLVAVCGVNWGRRSGPTR